jgi:hypothetical protein|tara:strand:+ start:12447 stop:12635 length:189 start_codon:yes stop_codon:yes gene_type:complete
MDARTDLADIRYTKSACKTAYNILENYSERKDHMLYLPSKKLCFKLNEVIYRLNELEKEYET